MQWNEMEDDQEYLVTVKGKAHTWQYGEEEQKAVSLYKPGRPTILVGYQDLKDPNTTIEIKEVP